MKLQADIAGFNEDQARLASELRDALYAPGGVSAKDVEGKFRLREEDVRRLIEQVKDRIAQLKVCVCVCVCVCVSVCMRAWVRGGSKKTRRKKKNMTIKMKRTVGRRERCTERQCLFMIRDYYVSHARKRRLR